jgi:cysteine synthase A
MISVAVTGLNNINVFAKLEAYNPTGSVKDRAAFYILKKCLDNGIIDDRTTILESTSGNFGVALSAYCKYLGIDFIAVVDPHITPMNEMLILSSGARVIKVTKPDKYGGYLLTRIEKIKELKDEIKNSYWVNQYENPLNAEAYYNTLGKEICFQMDEIDYAFLGVSSGGTITGVSRKIKENFAGSKIIAVDVEGSVIFGHPPQKRYIPGIGSSMVPKILEKANIDDVVVVDESSTIKACYELLQKNSLFVGGSSGSVMAGIRSYFSGKEISYPVNVVCVFPDRGERYYDTIYNPAWCSKILQAKSEQGRMPINV